MNHQVGGLPSIGTVWDELGPKRILVFLPGLSIGGAERVTVSFLTHPVVRSLDVALCVFTGGEHNLFADDLNKAGVEQFDLRAWRRGDPVALARLIALIRREKIDLIHAHGPEPAIYGAAARRFTGVPLVVTRHVIEETWTSWRQRIHVRMAVAAARAADTVIGVSAASAERLEQLAGLPAKSVKVVHNGIDWAQFADPDLRRRAQAVRRELGLTDDQPVLLVPSVLRAGKGHEVLFDAFTEIRQAFSNAVVLVAGDGERAAALRDHARAYADAVRFLGHRNDIPQLIALSDLVVLPSYSEALPTALIEAAAGERPVVATRVGGSAEVVRHGETGLLVAPGDAAQLAEAVITLLADRDLQKRFATAARQWAAERFSLDGQVARTLELWRDTLRSRGR